MAPSHIFVLWCYATVFIANIVCQPIEVLDTDLLNDDLETLVQQHVIKLRAYKCKHPQAVVVNASELLPDLNSHSLIYPHQTVLMRCTETSGCCRNKHICTSKTVHAQTLVFKVTNITTRKTSFTAISVNDDVECQCIMKPTPDSREED